MKEKSPKTKRKKWMIVLALLLLIPGLIYLGLRIYARVEPDSKLGFLVDPEREIAPGTPIDVFNGVTVYFNGGFGETHGRNLSADGYNIGLKYQCVEFIKRYYLERFGHKMPDPWGHAKSFFNENLQDGEFNTARGLFQYLNGSASPPKAEDILVIGPSPFNPYGHVAIIAEVGEGSLIIIQQNSGPPSTVRESFPLTFRNEKYFIDKNRVLGWLRLAFKEK